MSNKLTDERLEELILEVLLEDVKPEDFKITIDDPDDLKDFSTINKINKKLKPEPLATAGVSGSDDAARLKNYRKQLQKISSLDNDPGDISYNDVKLGMKTIGVKQVSRNLRGGNKFRKLFDYALANSFITKAFRDDEIKQKIQALRDKSDPLKNEEIEFLKNLNDKIVNDIDGETILSKKDAQDLINKRKTGDPGFFVGLNEPAKRNNYNRAKYQSLEVEIDDDSTTIDRLVQIYTNILTNDDYSSITMRSTLAKKIRDKQSYKDYVATARRAAADKGGYEFPEETGGTITPTRTSISPVGELAVSYSSLAPSSAKLSTAGNKAVYNLKLDPSLIETIESIEGTSMMAKIKSLAQFSKNMETELSGMTAGKAASYLRFLGYLSDAAREYEDASAGTVFETFLAAISKGVIIGSESGAADVITLAGDKPVYYSAKLYSSENIKQSDQAEKGFTAVAQAAIKDRPETGLIYVIGIKTNLTEAQLSDTENISFKKQKEGSTSKKIGEASKPSAIALCVLNIIPNSDGFDVYAIQNDKKFIMSSKITIKEDEDEETDKAPKAYMNKIMTEVANQNYWYAHIPIFSETTAATLAASQTGADWMRKKIEDFGSDALKSLAKAFTNLKTLDLLTQEHTAKSSKEKLDAATNMKYITDIQKEYGDFKTNYNDVVDDISTTKETDAGQRIKENKKKSLKDLDKLIERVILESMNKK